ncbi:hypothetical protein CRG98_025713 [Punica granatum]|uniref:F-box associated beta-propeller type 1 domain-containing protein n=2 Tax=Punica granatum TaxID=22663 RepID=A0A2I0JCE9_PUNGR|nr:hypothetical protein CRG98_025713 [Punica granatum]
MPYGARFAGSCHGIVCLVAHGQKFYLYNPTTEELKELPEPSPVLRTYNCFYSFVYDAQYDDYKLVRGSDLNYATLRRRDPTKVEIFSLKSGLWKTTRQRSNYSHIHGPCGKYLNGSIYWMYNNLIKLEHRGTLLLAFNVATGKFHEVALPLPCDRWYRWEIESVDLGVSEEDSSWRIGLMRTRPLRSLVIAIEIDGKPIIFINWANNFMSIYDPSEHITTLKTIKLVLGRPYDDEVPFVDIIPYIKAHISPRL